MPTPSPTSPSAGTGRKKLTLVLASIAGTLVAVELLLRLAGATLSPPPLYPGDLETVPDATADPLIGWKLPPSAELTETTADYTVTYRTNPQGFRSRYDFSRPAPGRRWVFVGDSFTFGSGVEEEETFPRLLEERFAGLTAYNLGIGGFGIDQMWLTLEHYGLPLAPERVILSFIRNDLDRSLTAYREGHVWIEKPLFRLDGGRLSSVTREHPPPTFERWLHQRLRLHGLWRRAERSLGHRFAVGYRWRLNRALFAAVRDTCREAGVPLLVVHLPVNRRPEVPLFARELAALGIDYLDLTPHLPTDADRLYYPNDHHFNAAGHRFAARVMAEHLARGAP